MCDRHAPVSDTDQCAHRGAIGSCSGWIVGYPEVFLRASILPGRLSTRRLFTRATRWIPWAILPWDSENYKLANPYKLDGVAG
jgi:hypothetical protein